MAQNNVFCHKEMCNKMKVSIYIKKNLQKFLSFTSTQTIFLHFYSVTISPGSVLHTHIFKKKKTSKIA